ncbi:hypothetical protein FRC09_007838 [Ceratobasidium sp. 395]|nr:hypothetical protein FRC09_007838 [Ceratobasidium sp. 395]
MEFADFFTVESSRGPIDAYGSGFGLDMSWCTSGTDGVASPLVHNDNPNSNTGHRLSYQSPNTQNPDYSNQLTPIDSPYGQFLADAASALNNTQDDLRVTDNTLGHTAGDSAWRHQKLDIIEPITAIYYPFDPTQLIDGGLPWPILDTSNNTPLPGDTNLLKGPPPTTPSKNGALDYDIDTIINWPSEAYDSIFMSPSTSESCTTDWTFESTSPREQPPPFSPSNSTNSGYSPDPPGFPSPPRLATLPLPPPLPPPQPLPLPLPPPLPPPPPQSSPGVILTKSESDARVASLKSQRRHRGVGRSLVELKCPFCGKIHRRPHALQRSSQAES